MIIGVDIDNTVVDTGSQWLYWLCNRFDIKEEYKDAKLPYDLTEAFNIPFYSDGYSFWKDPNLYEGLQPIENSVESLNLLYNLGHQIVFVSQAKGFHSKSKYYFIDRWFPFKSGVMLTKEKQYARVDVMIDDTWKVLDSMPDNVLTVKFKDEYTQLPPTREHPVFNSWAEIVLGVKF